MITDFIKEVKDFYGKVYETNFQSLTLKELEECNNKMIKFYSNPIVCNNETDEEKLYSFVAYDILEKYFPFVTKREDAASIMEYIDELLESIPKGLEETKKILVAYATNTQRRVNRIIRNNTNYNNHAHSIVMESDLDSYNYLYYYGENITENEYKIVDFFRNKVDDEKCTDIAKCTIDAFLRGAKNQGLDINNKSFVDLRYDIGFEKIAKRIVELLDGKLNVILRENSIPFNRQVKYNHRYDYTLYFSQEYIDEYLQNFKEASEKVIDTFSKYAGPIVFESFGKNRFVPENGHQVFEKSSKAAKLKSTFNTKYAYIYDKNIRNDTTFSIISYPCPEIGKDFEEIFEETIKINTLDNYKYQKIHQSIIDVLDKAEYVSITGRNGNTTNLKIALTKLSNPDTESIFENCCADVNVPVGEVFTSPKLTGTNGTLHVSEIYLNGWKFKDLDLKIKDGFIEKYSCSNYETLEENNEYINEHILFDNETLPMGEFAIGTNTYAYVMGNKYNINDKLDILIAEKTGPHFAFGDTCFSMEEDIETFNPDGKKIVAKDNEVSVKRLSEDSEEAEEAYFGCHTDITIPYSELGDIKAVTGEREVFIIHEGRFVLEGTKELNIEGM